VIVYTEDEEERFKANFATQIEDLILHWGLSEKRQNDWKAADVLGQALP